MRVEELQYDLPQDRIASRPLERRSDSRMLVVTRSDGRLRDRAFLDLPDQLRPGDLVVVNNTRVVPARLRGLKVTGGAVEILLVEPDRSDLWWALGRSRRPFRPGTMIRFETAEATVEATAPGGRVLLRFSEDALTVAAREGRVPIPPYIPRPDDAEDRERYQTVFATTPGAVAAPTAALHFDQATLSTLRERGVEIGTLTLHVGPGTFQPIRTETLAEHSMEGERYTIPPALAQAVARARAAGGRVIAVGTTSTRALETAADGSGGILPGSGRTELFITPGYRFQVVDALLTNFHLPGSTLIALVMALAGVNRIRESYAHAVAAGYRFYSYGDCMFIA